MSAKNEDKALPDDAASQPRHGPTVPGGRSSWSSSSSALGLW